MFVGSALRIRSHCESSTPDPATIRAMPRTSAITSGQKRDHHWADVKGAQPLVGQNGEDPIENPETNNTKPPTINPSPIPGMAPLRPFDIPEPQEKARIPMQAVKAFGQTVDHVPTGSPGQDCARLHPTGKETNSAAMVKRTPAETAAYAHGDLLERSPNLFTVALPMPTAPSKKRSDSAAIGDNPLPIRGNPRGYPPRVRKKKEAPKPANVTTIGYRSQFADT